MTRLISVAAKVALLVMILVLSGRQVVNADEGDSVITVNVQTCFDDGECEPGADYQIGVGRDNDFEYTGSDAQITQSITSVVPGSFPVMIYPPVFQGTTAEHSEVACEGPEGPLEARQPSTGFSGDVFYLSIEQPTSVYCLYTFYPTGAVADSSTGQPVADVASEEPSDSAVEEVVALPSTGGLGGSFEKEQSEAVIVLGLLSLIFGGMLLLVRRLK